MSLLELKQGESGKIIGFLGNDEFLSKVISKGFKLNSLVRIIRNNKGMPILAFVSDTQMAIGRREAEKIKIRRVE